ncbi:MAG: biopolymer transporter ExbD [Pseudomonadota bacterium]
MLGLAPPRKPRKPSLTPMIDVVFLLLVFFMLASRFGSDYAVPMKLAGGSAASTGYSGPPRVIDVLPEGERLNGVTIETDALVPQVASLTESLDDTIIIRPRNGAVLQRIVDVMTLFEEAGHTTLVLVE